MRHRSSGAHRRRTEEGGLEAAFFSFAPVQDERRLSRRPAIGSICALAVVLLLQAPFPAAFADSHLSSDPRIKHARSLVEGGRFDEALSVLRPLAPDHPDRTDVRFLIGLAAIGASGRTAREERKTVLLDEAIAALRAILFDRPGLVRVRLELARAFFLKGEDGLSRKHFERVLAGRPPPAVAANVHRFLRAIRARRRWNAWFGFDVAPDTNVNAASDADAIHILGLPLRLDEDARARSGFGVVLRGGGEYQHPLTGRMRLRAGADVARREYAGREFDQTVGSAHLGPRILASEDTEFSLLATTGRRWRAGRPYSRDLGIRFEAERRLSRRLTARGHGAWRRRTYRRNDDSLDGPLVDVSLGVSWLVRPTVRTDAAVGYVRERPKSLVWRNAGPWARLGASFALPLGFTLGGSAELRWTGYEGRWWPYVPDGSSRRDRTTILRVSTFNRAFTVFGFSPRLALVNEARGSNAQLYDYRRTRLEVGFVQQF